MKLKKPHYLRRSWLAASALVGLSASSASAQIIAGWDTYSGNGGNNIPVEAPVLAPGITASFVTTTEQNAWNTVDERGASSDGTWGTLVGPPAADTTVGTNNDQNLELSNATPGGTITMTISNNSGEDIDLNAFHMDALAFRARAARTYSVDVLPGGAITAGSIFVSGDQEITSQGSLPPDNDQGDDIDHDLSFLLDSTLEDGGTFDIQVTFSGGAGDNSGGHDLWIDNLAVSASTVGADQLAITAAPNSAVAGTDFAITIEAQDGNGVPLTGGVSQDTTITLNTVMGTGILSGNTATIPMGSNSITLPSVQYTVAEDIALIASQTSGDLLVPSMESALITINVGLASVVGVESANDGSGNPIGNTSFRINGFENTLDVFAVSRDSVGNFISAEPSATFTLENLTGSVMAADLTDNMDGSATFTIQNLGTAVIRASVDGLTSVDSGLITVEEPQFRWVSTGDAAWGNALNWLDVVAPPFDNTTDLFFVDEFATNLRSVLSADRTVRSLNFTEFLDPTTTQPFFGIRYTIANSQGVPASLTLDTDSGVPAEINIAAGAESNIDLGDVNNGFIPDLPENYGDLILAVPLLVTHSGSGTLSFSRPITESEAPTSVTIDGTSTGVVSFRAANTFTGPTNVNGGVLNLRNGNAIEDTAALQVNGGVVDVQDDESVGNLFIDGVRQEPGIYGSSNSAAPIENQDDTRFSGSGTITSLGAIQNLGRPVIVGFELTNSNFTLTWTSNPGETFTVFCSRDLESFIDDIADGVPSAPNSGFTQQTYPRSLIGDDVQKAFLRVVRE